MDEKGANNISIRSINRVRTINLLCRRGPMTKQAVARCLSLSLPTVLQIIKELSARGLVREEGRLASTGGRKPMLISLAADARIAVGAELAQDHMRFVLVDLTGKAVFRKSVSVPFRDNESYYKRLGAEINALTDEVGVKKENVLGVGVAVPGIVGSDGQTVEFAPTMGLRGLPAEKIQAGAALPVILGNNANLAGFSEIRGKEQYEDAVFLTVDKGVGGAVLAGGHVYPGRGGRAGEFGHMTIKKDGRECSCGRRGCLEAYCTTRVLSSAAGGDLDAFFNRLERGDAACVPVWDRYLDDLATGIASIRMIFDTDIIIGGDIAPHLESRRAALCSRLAEKNPFGDGGGYIHTSKNGEMAGSIGAALLFVDKFLENLGDE